MRWLWLSCFFALVVAEEPGTAVATVAQQREWRDKVLAYARDINAFVDIGQREGWEKAGEQPEAPKLEHLVPLALAAIRQAKDDDDLKRLRDLWPPAHGPLIPLLKKDQAEDIPVVCLLDDGSIVARIESGGGVGRTVRIRDGVVAEQPGIGFFGRSPDRRYFAVAQQNGVAVHEGWRGPQVALCPWPTGKEDLPRGNTVVPWERKPDPTRLIPFPDGKRVLLVGEQGIFLLSAAGARRVLPTTKDLEENPDDLSLSMQHGAVSKDGTMIAVGHQDSSHLVFDDQLKLLGDIGNRSEYPHCAIFSADQRTIAFNSCHFYHGLTIAVPVSLLPGLRIKAYEEDERTPLIEGNSRVYAGTSRNDEFIIVDANGYVRAFNPQADYRWQQFVGSSGGDLDISPDGRTMVVSTHAGFIAVFAMDAGAMEAHQIGTGKHREVVRWVFWKGEKPFRW